MSTREYKIGVVGTFDVENYGDLLFPLVARRELEERLGRVALQYFSYRTKSAKEWPFPVTSVEELPRRVATLDALLIGGGLLVRFDKAVAAGYLPPTAWIHHPTGYWLSPALMALQHGIPVMWNAPGVNYDDLPEWANPLLEAAFSHSSYIAVRDEPSRAALERFAGKERIEVVPDTAFGLERLLSESTESEFRRLLEACGVAGPYILLQGAWGQDSCHRFLKRHAERLAAYRIVVVPIGPVNGDDELPGAGLKNLVRLPAWPHPLVLAELIRHAAGAIGSSYHLAITALTAGVPMFKRPNRSAGTFPGLEGFDGVYALPTEYDDPERFLSCLGASPVSSAVVAAVERQRAHWDRVAEVTRRGRTAGADALGHLLQSLPGLLETTSVHGGGAGDASAASQQATAVMAAEMSSLQLRIAELERVVALARTEIALRDQRIALLLRSTSWRLTAPMRFVARCFRNF